LWYGNAWYLRFTLCEECFWIEVSPEAALDARMNAKLNGAKNVTIICGAVRHVLHQVQEDGNPIHPADLVIIDPPRTGLDQEALQGVLSLNLKKFFTFRVIQKRRQ
jgi:23S rRNA (uracil1939-C5)-methyltransferase